MPVEAECNKVKEIMIEKLICERKLNSALPVNKSMLSLLSGDSRYNDSQLSAYAKVIEDIKKPGHSQTHHENNSQVRFQNDTGGSGMFDL